MVENYDDDDGRERERAPWFSAAASIENGKSFLAQGRHFE